MAIQSTDTIDLIARRKSGEVLLVIKETNTWQDPRISKMLERKIKTYQHFIQTDEYRQKFGDSPAMICLSTKYRPTREIKTMLDESGVRMLSD